MLVRYRTIYIPVHSRLATDTKISDVSVGVGVEISTPKKVGVGVSFSDTH